MQNIVLPPTRPYDTILLDNEIRRGKYFDSCRTVLCMFESLVDYTHLDEDDDNYWDDYERETLRQVSELKELREYASWCSDICKYIDTVYHFWDETGNDQWITEVKATTETIFARYRLGKCKQAVISKTAHFELSEAAIALLKAKHGFERTNFDNRRNLQALVDVVEALGDYASAVPGDFIVVPLQPESIYVVSVKDGTEILAEHHQIYDIKSGRWKEPDGIVIGTWE
jgi:hypothetical protein